MKYCVFCNIVFLKKFTSMIQPIFSSPNCSRRWGWGFVICSWLHLVLISSEEDTSEVIPTTTSHQVEEITIEDISDQVDHQDAYEESQAQMDRVNI